MKEPSQLILHPLKRKELFEKGQDLFNDESFFEAHEEWETLWHLEGDRDRGFIQGLIQAAGHFVHLKKGQSSGAASLATSAREKLKIPPGNTYYLTLDISPILSAMEYNVIQLQKAKDAFPDFGRFLIPKLY